MNRKTVLKEMFDKTVKNFEEINQDLSNRLIEINKDHQKDKERLVELEEHLVRMASFQVQQSKEITQLEEQIKQKDQKILKLEQLIQDKSEIWKEQSKILKYQQLALDVQVKDAIQSHILQYVDKMNIFIYNKKRNGEITDEQYDFANIAINDTPQPAYQYSEEIQKYWNAVNSKYDQQHTKGPDN